MRYYKIERDKKIFTFIYESKMKYIFIEDKEELEVDSIIHARVKLTNRNLGYSFIELGQYGAGFFDGVLKSGEDYFFNIKKKPEGEKGYVLNFDIKIKTDNLMVFPNSNHYYNNEYEKITNMPTLILNEDISPCELTSDAIDIVNDYKKLLEIKNTLPIPKPIFIATSESERLINGYNILQGNKEDVFKAMVNTEGLVDGSIKTESGSIIVDSRNHFAFIDFNSDDKGDYYSRELNHLDKNIKLLKKAIEITELRNIEGMILIDLLKMKDYKKLIVKLDGILKRNYIFHDITKLGILELTKKKSGKIRISDENVEGIIGVLRDDIY